MIYGGDHGGVSTVVREARVTQGKGGMIIWSAGVSESIGRRSLEWEYMER